MIRATLQITHATIKQAWHTRTITWLLFAAAFPAVLFPIILKGDGSPQGALMVQLTYAPTAIFAVLLIASIWIGAFSLASERQQQFAMLRTKPVSGFTIWLGKWLGVCLINAVTLLLSGMLFALMLGIRNQNIPSTGNTVWRAFLPDETEIIQQAQHTFAMLAKQAQPEGHAIPTPQQWVNRLRQQHYRVAPGETTSWQIPLPENRNQATHWRLRFRWRLDPMRRAPVRGTWVITAAGTATPLALYTITERLDGDHEIAWHDLALPPGPITLELKFRADADNQPHIFFDSREPVGLQQAAGTLGMNLFRAAGIMLIFCAAITALALLLSACLSFPVAVFATYGVILALLIAAVAGQESMHFTHSHGHDHDQHAAEWLLAYTGHFLDRLHSRTQNLRDALPFRPLAENLLITYRQHRPILVFLILLLPLLCGLLTHIRMAREEIPQ